MLDPGKLVSLDYTGDVSVETFRRIEFTLINDVKLNFDVYFRYKKNDEGERVTFTEHIAEFEIDRKFKNINLLIHTRNDFLILVSLAERKPCVCLGWDLLDSSNRIKNYRRGITIPKRSDNNPFTTLIDIEYFMEFIQIAYNKFHSINHNELIRQSIYKIISESDQTIENSFMSLYSAIENLVLFFRRNHRLEYALDKEQWVIFKRDVEKYVKRYLKETLKIEGKGEKEIYLRKI